MKSRNFINIFITLLMSFSLIACGESTKEKADKLITEYNGLVADIIMVPSSNWPDSELNSYTKKLDRFESLYYQIKKLDSKSDKLFVLGGTNATELIAERRSDLQSAFSEKAANIARDKVQKKIDGLNKFVNMFENKLNRLRKDSIEGFSHDVTDSTSNEELMALLGDHIDRVGRLTEKSSVIINDLNKYDTSANSELETIKSEYLEFATETESILLAKRDQIKQVLKALEDAVLEKLAEDRVLKKGVH